MNIASRMTRSILLATDFSKPARRVYSYALSLASIFKARLILLHVVEAPPGFETWSPAARRSLGPLKTRALLELGRMARLAKDNGVTAEHRLVIDIPEDGILNIAGKIRADLIAIGTHGRTGWDRLRLGSVAEAVLRKAGCPVLTVQVGSFADAPVRRHRPKWHRFLVPIDFTASSDAALRFAAMLAEQLHAQISVVHVFDPWAAVGQDDVRVRELKTHKLAKRVQKVMSASKSDLSGFNIMVAPGDAVEVILDRATREMADLIVMGTQGRRGLQRLVLGSVAESVVRRAGCPVLVVKAAKRSRNH